LCTQSQTYKLCPMMLGIVLKYESCYKKFTRLLWRRKLKDIKFMVIKKNMISMSIFNFFPSQRWSLWCKPLCKPIHNPKILETNWFPQDFGFNHLIKMMSSFPRFTKHDSTRPNAWGTNYQTLLLRHWHIMDHPYIQL